MRKTHDLSAGIVTLDYQALLQTTKIATGCLLESVSVYQAALRTACQKGDITGIKLSGERLEREAKHLAIVSHTLATLTGGLSRPELKVVNHYFGWICPSGCHPDIVWVYAIGYTSPIEIKAHTGNLTGWLGDGTRLTDDQIEAYEERNEPTTCPNCLKKCRWEFLDD